MIRTLTSRSIINRKTGEKEIRISLQKKLLKNWQLSLMILLPLIYLILFKYVPLLGVQIAFKDYSFKDGIWGSEWVGLEHFIRFFESYQFIRVLKNTLYLSVYQLAASFPMPILLALSLNSIGNEKYKKVVQTVTYAPHFISTVVIVGLLFQLLDSRIGLVNSFIELIGLTKIEFFANADMFSSVYVWSGVWQNVGYSSIIYLGVLAGVDPELYEAAVVDGANKLEKVIHIDIPAILPTATILLIMNLGRVLRIGFEKVLLLQNALNMEKSEVISTYVYKVGLASSRADFSYATAIGLFNSVIGFILIVIVNRIAKKMGDTSLW